MSLGGNSETAARNIALVRLAGLHTFVVDADVVKPCRELRHALGLPDGQPISCEAFRAFIHADDRDRVLETSDRLRREGCGTTTLDFRMHSVAGWRWARTTLCAEVQSDGRVLLHGLQQDVTELIEAREVALAAERQVRGLMEESRVAARRLKLALGVAQAGAFEIDHEHRRFWCSPEFVLLVGQRMTFDQAAALPWPFFHPDDTPALRQALESWKIGAMLHQSLDLRVVRDGGALRWVRLYCEFRRDRAGRLKRCVGMLIDIDERKRGELALAEAERAAKAANETKSRFLASMSHEIRTPMNGVVGVLHLLRAEPLSEGGRGLLDEALQCGHMLSELINDILDLSKIEAGQMQLAPEPTDPGAALRGVANLLRPQAEAKGLTLTIDAEFDGWSRIDPVRLRQTLFNLMGNAVKFTHAGGVQARMTIQGQGAGRRLRFEIEDTGVGIPEAARPRLFERFQQADDSATRQFGGTGLGLAITRNLVRLMGGEVGFDSEEGRGSTFWFDIAAPEAAARIEPTLPAPCDRLEGLSVLVVDDNAANRMIVRKILENVGAVVETAEDGAAGVQAAAGGLTPSVILMDVQMPGMDGLEATRRIRALSGPAAQAPIIALTANVLEHQRQVYLACGMDGVVGKPIAPASLLAEILRLAPSPGLAPLARAG
jgi:signal transduction histidine kinase/CheY-like chemotaxis protein